MSNVYKLVLVGVGGVGKSCLTIQVSFLIYIMGIIFIFFIINPCFLFIVLNDNLISFYLSLVYFK